MSTDITRDQLKSILENDSYLQPVLMDDALLYGNFNIF